MNVARWMIFWALCLFAAVGSVSAQNSTAPLDSLRTAYDALTKEFEKAQLRRDEIAMADIAHRQGLLLLKQQTRRSRKAAKVRFQTSLEYLADYQTHELYRANIQQLQYIATLQQDQRSFKKWGKQLSRFAEKELEKADRAVSGLLNAKKRLNSVNEENERLSAQIDTLAEDKRALALEKEELALEKARLDMVNTQLDEKNNQLDEVLQKREAAIQKMTEQQMKAELLLTRQKQLVDSLQFTKVIDAMQLERQQLVLEQKEMQLEQQKDKVELQRSQRNLFLALAAFILLLAIGLYARYLSTRKNNVVLETKNQAILEEKQRNENLLLNILPSAIAGELKKQGHVKASFHEQVTVMFIDFKDFSRISRQLDPTQLIELLDHCFKGFDRIVGHYELEKIKTIGDAYMCAGGVPQAKPDHPLRMIQAAIDMQQFLTDLKAERKSANLPFFEARVGIHTGPIIAGVVGDKKFAYDIWGDTVNIAARMESSSEVGKVNISQTTYELVQDQVQCEYRGKVSAKNVGEIDMYYVLS
ncbi:MAG: adenylate/guanylate cyclase domain-containing protein [Bacteroidota bacterium]